MTKDQLAHSRFFSQFPQGFISLIFVQIFSTLSFSVLYSSLVLYMTRDLGFAKSHANNITGFFIAFNYGLHLLGGFFGGRLMTNRLLFSLGMLFLIGGCLLLSIPNPHMLYWGLAVFLTGSGLNVTCFNCMVTQRFKPDDKMREVAFFWLYSGMNIGFFTGYMVSGWFEKISNYQILFLLGSLGNLMALFLVGRNWRLLKDIDTPLSKLSKKMQSRKCLQGVALVLLMIPALHFLVQYSDISNRFVLTVGSLMICVLLTLAVQQKSKASTKKMFAFVILMVASLVFWALYQIAPMGLTLFIKHNVHAQLFGVYLTPQWVQNVNTIVIILGGPLTSYAFTRLRAKGIKINIPAQFSVALLLIGVAYLILTLGIRYADFNGLTNINWVILSYVLQSLGELLISPVGYAMIGQLAPAHLQGVMMGSWMMVTGVAAVLSKYFSNMMVGASQSDSALLTNDSYSHVFSMLGVGAILTAVVLLFLVPTLKRLINESNDDSDDDVSEVLEAEMA